jgi:malate dehydrogenase (oxaloacetate-decarboxylating)(NADP+)
VGKAAGIYILLTKNGPLFLADTTINTDPSVDDIVEIVENTAIAIKRMGLTPKIALLSYSNFGSVKGELPNRMQKATELVRKKMPNLLVDGEMQANFAINNKLLKEVFPFSELVGKKPNGLIFPGLASGNIAYKLMQSYGAAEAIGPLLVGLNRSAHVLQMGSGVREIVNMATLAVVDAQRREEGITV